MTWEWFQDMVAVGEVAEKCAALANEKRKIMFVIPLTARPPYPGRPEMGWQENVVIVSCKGTAILKVKKAKDEQA